MQIKSIGKNQTELHLNDKIIFISYETPVACLMTEYNIFYATSTYHSVTTSIHIDSFLDRHGAKQEKIGEVPQDFFDQLIA